MKLKRFHKSDNTMIWDRCLYHESKSYELLLKNKYIYNINTSKILCIKRHLS